MVSTDWNNLFKVKISNIVDTSMDKHDIIKLLIVRKLLRKYTKRAWIRIYTEFKLNGMTPDVYVEHIKDKSIICYEIQKEASSKYTEEKIKQYKKYEEEEMFFKSVNLIIIPLKECPDDITQINNWLDKYIF